jgi:phosphoglycolate phosphatase
MNNITHVIWDWNGTLLDDRALCVDIMNGILARRSRGSIDEETYRKLIEFPVQIYYERLGFDFSNEPFEAVSDEYVRNYQARWRECALQAGALETMEALRQAGVGQSVLSASKTPYLLEQLEHFGLTGYLQRMTGVDDHHGRGKGHRAVEHLAALGVAPEQVVLIGDTAHDAEVAQVCGANCILVSFGHYDLQRLQRVGVPIAHSMEEVREILFKD